MKLFSSQATRHAWAPNIGRNMGRRGIDRVVGLGKALKTVEQIQRTFVNPMTLLRQAIALIAVAHGVGKRGSRRTRHGSKFGDMTWNRTCIGVLDTHDQRFEDQALSKRCLWSLKASTGVRWERRLTRIC